MYIRFKRMQGFASSFNCRVVNLSKTTEDCIYLKKPNKGSTLTAKGRVNQAEIELNVYNVFSKKNKENDIIKEQSGDFTIGNQQGQIYYCSKKGSNFLNGIYFWSFENQNSRFEVYEVGFGKKGVYLCIWNEGSLIAVIDKKLHTIRFESEYAIFFENESNYSLLMIVATFWDVTRWLTDSGEEWHTLNTWQKELKNKYDPNFIPKIKAMDGIID